MKKILFITTQFLTEKTAHGGIGNYIYKMSKALVKQGHQADVLVTSRKETGQVKFNDIQVYRVLIDHFWNRVFRKLSNRFFLKTFFLLADQLYVSWLVRKEFKRLNRENSYDIVQVPNYQTPGLFIKRSRFYRLYTRISSNRILFDTAEYGSISLMSRIENRLDLFQAKKSDLVYAPSKYLATYIRDNQGLNVSVLYPPAVLGDIVPMKPFENLPPDYFIHFGYLSRRKGTDIVAEALKKAAAEYPDIHLLFAGKMHNNLNYLLGDEFWGEFKNNIIFTGFLEKKKLYGLVQGACAAVLPSRADNYPNTVVESICLGTPVIGTYDSSIEEIVKSGENGMLVGNGNIEELSAALIDIWNVKHSFGEQKIKNSLQRFNTEKSVHDFMRMGSS